MRIITVQNKPRFTVEAIAKVKLPRNISPSSLNGFSQSVFSVELSARASCTEQNRASGLYKSIGRGVLTKQPTIMNIAGNFLQQSQFPLQQ
jgi:hypothetical protein